MSGVKIDSHKAIVIVKSLMDCKDTWIQRVQGLPEVD